MEHVTIATLRETEQWSQTQDRNSDAALWVRAADSILTSTQIEALATAAEQAAVALIELSAHGDILLHSIHASDAARTQTALVQAGLRVTETPGDAAVNTQPRAESGLQHVELSVPEGRITPRQLRELARLARTYADCELRVTATRNLLIVNMPRANLALLLREPVLRELRPETIHE